MKIVTCRNCMAPGRAMDNAPDHPLCPRCQRVEKINALCDKDKLTPKESLELEALLEMKDKQDEL